MVVQAKLTSVFFFPKLVKHLCRNFIFFLTTKAASSLDAEDGLRFMQEMIELSSQQQKEQQLPPRAVQIVSHPFFGRVVLTAGPAQFGMDLSKHKSGVCKNVFDFSFLLLFLIA